MMKIDVIEKRLQSLAAIQNVTRLHVPPAVKLVSIDWNSNPPYFYYYFERETTENDKEEIEEPFSHVDMFAVEQYEFKFIKTSSPTRYHGECVFARKEDNLEPTAYIKEHSKCSFSDGDAFLKSSSGQAIKEFKKLHLQGFGELVEFKQSIGHYLNPTTNEKRPTSKGLVYYGKHRTYVIPALPEKNLPEILEQQFNIDFSVHVYREANRALLGRVIPSLIYFQVAFLKTHLLLSFTTDEGIGEDERENLELVAFETMAGMTEEMDFDIQFSTAKSVSEVPALGSCIYGREEARV